MQMLTMLLRLIPVRQLSKHQEDAGVQESESTEKEKKESSKAPYSFWIAPLDVHLTGEKREVERLKRHVFQPSEQYR